MILRFRIDVLCKWEWFSWKPRVKKESITNREELSHISKWLREYYEHLDLNMQILSTYLFHTWNNLSESKNISPKLLNNLISRYCPFCLSINRSLIKWFLFKFLFRILTCVTTISYCLVRPIWSKFEHIFWIR